MKIDINKLRKHPDLKFSIKCFTEDIPVRGNASAIDPETDKATEDYIFSELENGNQWAWCVVKVTAEIDEFLKGYAYLGTCSYKNQDDFENGGYYEDMKEEALIDLIQDIERVFFQSKSFEPYQVSE